MNRFLLFCLLTLLLASCNNSPEITTLKKIQKTYYESQTSPEFVSKVFFSSYSVSNGQYLSFNDGSYYFVCLGDQAAVPMSNYLFVSDNVRKLNSRELYSFNTKNTTEAYKNSASEYYDFRNISEMSDIPSNPQVVYKIMRRLDYKGPLSKKRYKEFTYKLDTIKNGMSLVFAAKGNYPFSGVIFFNPNDYGIDSIYVNCEAMSDISNDWCPASYKIVFENNTVRSITEQMFANDILSVKKMSFIPGTIRQFDAEMLPDRELMCEASVNGLVLYDSLNFEQYKPYFLNPYEDLFYSFGGKDVVEAQFKQNNNKMFLHYVYQNKNAEIEKRVIAADSTARADIDKIYDFKRWNYYYSDAAPGGECPNTTLKCLNNRVDFGGVSTDTTLTAYFKYVNTGIEKLYFLHVKPDCDCTSFAIKNNGALPQDTVTLELKYSTKGKRGVNHTYAIITANTKDKLYKARLTSEIK